MDRVHYFIDQKNPHHGHAIATGFGAKMRNSLNGRLEPGALHLIGGLQFGSLTLLQQAMERGDPYIFFDRAYFGGGPGTNRLRAVPNAYQKWWYERWPDDRAKALYVRWQPWRKSGRHILVVPPSSAVYTLFGVEKMWRDPLALIGPTDRPVLVSYKGDPTPLDMRLKNCHCVVTWTSNVAVEALLAGVPVFASRHSAASPCALPLESLRERLETPWLPEFREQWASNLAYGQFTLDEIRSGYASSIVMEHFRHEGRKAETPSHA